MPANNGVSYLLGDHLGSTNVVVDPNGNLVSELRYRAWGETRYSSGTAPTDYRYTGQREEAGIGLYYYGARWYDPALGRFAQRDAVLPRAEASPVQDRYVYGGNNPIKNSDTSGQCWGAASFIRGLPSYATTCTNLDLALTIVQHDESSPGEKAIAGGYVVLEGAAHVALAIGTAALAIEGASAIGASIAGAKATTAGAAATAACADGDCTNEARAAGRVTSFLAETLPPLRGRAASAFSGRSVALDLQPGRLLYRVEATVQPVGRWFGTQPTTSAARADRWWNVLQYGKREVLRAYEVIRPVTVYYGTVAGGRGTQIYISPEIAPKLTDVVRMVGEWKMVSQ